MAKRWDYSDASITTAGTMICTACRKKITEGAFRYRETDESYLTQHKACSLNDLEWKQIEKRQQEYAAFNRRRMAALRAFIEEFGEPSEELIIECAAKRSLPSRKGDPEKEMK